MANVIIDNTNLTNIANAIREKNGTEETYKPSEMAQAIEDLTGGVTQESSAANMDTYLSTKPVDSMYEYTGTSTSTYVNGRLYRIEEIMPTKGQLINMTLGNTAAAGTNDQYRVLSINGTIAEVVAMYDYNTSCAYNSSRTNTYSGAELDTMLNTTFYGSLTDTAKAAIVQKNITSYEYTYNSSVYNATTHASYADYSTKATHESIGNRYVYALDVEDIENYFSNTFSTADIWTLFWNTTSAPSTVTYPWLRSADADYSDRAWLVYGNSGNVLRRSVSFANGVRPAFCIDLSKISWS